jgi:hypothetical protein
MRKPGWTKGNMRLIFNTLAFKEYYIAKAFRIIPENRFLAPASGCFVPKGEGEDQGLQHDN